MDILFYVLTAAFANVLGGLVIFLKKNWSRRGLNGLMALSAGLLFTIAIMDLIPEALEIHESSAVYIVIGFGLIFLFQQFLAPHFHFGEETHKHSHSQSTTLGALRMRMLVHTFFDGVSIVASFKIDEKIGFVVLIAVLLHKIPDGLTISSIVFASLKSKKKAIEASFLLGISTILGAIATLSLTQFFPIDSNILAIALSITSGIFLYIATVDLLPVVSATEDRPIILFFFVGILLYFALHLILDQLSFHVH
ncbi:ZIP family metal transporter [Cytobacillus sp. S13-E01]|uniref:ZIP family metal transporter n=1 Tax=Cytobacillus sp. S13-E01 TaxID=3031326 RepID=UPI0023D7C55A|nr:ZIP family metal transporter [Cytobacillus sp. S13-E01]MDF0728744.1 ZIP family metal transporter [Cytobacillus sp. S13-E01]